MKVAFYCLVLFPSLLFSQSYLNVFYSDGTNQSTSLSTLTKITYDQGSGLVSFYGTDIGTVSKDLSTIHKFTFDNSGSGYPLPVELSSFTCSANGQNISLVWVTQTEKNSKKFDIQRNLITSEWTTLGSVKTAGFSNSPKQYSYTDNKLQPGKYQYRLKMIDNDGSFEYSKVFEVEIAAPKEFSLSQNYPNPFNPSTKISYSIPRDGQVSLIVYDILGKAVASLVNESEKAGSYDVTFDGSRLASGVYICKMTSRDYTNSIKMLIIK